MDIFTGLPFKDTNGSVTTDKKAKEFKEYISGLDVSGKATAYTKIMSIPSDEATKQFITNTLANMTRADMEAAIAPAKQTGMDESSVAGYIASIATGFKGIVHKALTEQFKAQYAVQVSQQAQ